jgi:cytochrome P450
VNHTSIASAGKLTKKFLIASFQRKVLKPFSLSNGQVIPAGVTIEIPAVAVSSDSNVFPQAEKFDPLRFYRLRNEAKDGGSVEKAANNQFVSVNQSSLTFGNGRHVSPEDSSPQTRSR